MNEFYEELENDEGESDDDLTDLYPWMKEKQEEKDSGMQKSEFYRGLIIAGSSVRTIAVANLLAMSHRS